MRSQGQVVVSSEAEGRLDKRAVIRHERRVHAGPDTTVLILHTCDRCQYFGIAKGFGPNLCTRENRITADEKTNATPDWCPFVREAGREIEHLAEGVAAHYKQHRAFAVQVQGIRNGLHPDECVISFMAVKNVEEPSKPITWVPAMVAVSRRSMIDDWFPAGFIQWSACRNFVLAEFPDDITPGLSRRAWLPVEHTRNAPQPR